MTLVDDMIAAAADAVLDSSVAGETATYTPAAGTGAVSIAAVFGPVRQDEMAIGEGEMRKERMQILVARTGASGVADPKRGDTISRGDSQSLEEYVIEDFVEKNAAAAICICRRRYRNEATRTGARPAD